MITAVILAAGQSRRMGQSKMLLPWGNATVLEQVVTTCRAAGVEEVLVVTGAKRTQIEAIIAGSARTVFNPDFARREMLSSIQVGLENASGEAALIALGDQPQVQVSSVRLILEEFARGNATIIIPSYRRKRGHPWLIARQHWEAISQMRYPKSMRDFLKRQASAITHVNVDDPNILLDLDTPEDYQRTRP